MVNPIDNPELYDVIKLAGKRSPGKMSFVSAPARDEGWDKQQAKGAAGTKLVHNETPAIEFEVELFLWRDFDRDCFAEWEAWKPVLRLSAPRPSTTTPTSAQVTADPKVQAARAALVETTKETEKFRPTAQWGSIEARAEIEAQQRRQDAAQRAFDVAVKGASTVKAPKQVAIDIYHPQLAGLEPPVTSVVVKSWTEPAPLQGKKTGAATVRIKFIEQRPMVGVGSGAVSGSASGTSRSSGADPNADLKKRVAELTAEFNRP